MKKNTLIIGLFTAFALSSCYEDKSTLPENPIDGVELNVTEEEKVIRIGYKEQLDIVPNITKNGKVDDSGLTYEWAVNIYPGWSKYEYEVIGTEKELHTVLNNAISNDSYYLRLLVTDTKHDDLQYSFLYQVFVQPSMLDGLLIADTKDGQTTDFNLVMNNKLTASYDKEEKIFRSILAGKEYPGLIKAMSPITSGYYPGVNMMSVIDEEGKAGIYDTENFNLLNMSKLFVYQPERIDAIIRIGQHNCAATDMGFFAVQYVNFTSSYFGWINGDLSKYSMDNGVYAKTSLTGVNNATYALGAWFCNEEDAFVSADMLGYPAPTATLFNNPNDYDLSNKRAVCGGMSVDEVTPTFLLKDESTGEYTIYVLERAKDATGYYDDNWNFIETAPAEDSYIKAAHIIPAEGKTLLDKAVATSFASMEAILYVATEDGVYTINFAGATPTVNSTSQFTANGEKITGMHLYQQGAEITEYGSMGYPGYPEYGGWLPVELTDRAVVVTTQKGDEGVVYVVPMIRFGTGDLDPSNALRYDGFGRILAVSATCY